MSEYVKYLKDPEALLDYTVNWTDFLGIDVIVSSDWSLLTYTGDVTVDIVNESETFADDSATIWISGGVLGNIYTVTNHIVTTGGREDDRSFHLQIEEQ